jgi:hypothetical protein
MTALMYHCRHSAALAEDAAQSAGVSIDETLHDDHSLRLKPFCERPVGFAFDQRLQPGDVAILSVEEFASVREIRDLLNAWGQRGVTVVVAEYPTIAAAIFASIVSMGVELDSFARSEQVLLAGVED